MARTANNGARPGVQRELFFLALLFEPPSRPAVGTSSFFQKFSTRVLSRPLQKYDPTFNSQVFCNRNEGVVLLNGCSCQLLSIHTRRAPRIVVAATTLE